MKEALVSKQKLRQASMTVGLVLMIASKIYAVTLDNQMIGPLESGQMPDQNEANNLYFNLGVSVFCTLFAGLMSGLTIGLASIDRLSLEVDSIGNP